MLGGDGLRLDFAGSGHQFADMLRCGAAAAAHQTGTAANDIGHNVGELLGGDIKNGFSVFAAGQTGIGLHQHGH